jgi:hypothetical protein
MLTDRILGALMFRSGVYSEVEKDESFTQVAWIIVGAVAFVSALGTQASTLPNVIKWILAAAIFSVFSVAGFALGALVISWIGKNLFNADVNFGEVVRTLGLAYVWNAVGFLGILGVITPIFSCITGPIQIVAWLASLVAALLAVKEALDLDWGKTVITVLAGWVAIFVVTMIAGFVLGALALTTRAVLSIF